MLSLIFYFVIPCIETKNNKAPGKNALVAEQFKNLSENAIAKLTHLFNATYESERPAR